MEPSIRKCIHVAEDGGVCPRPAIRGQYCAIHYADGRCFNKYRYYKKSCDVVDDKVCNDIGDTHSMDAKTVLLKVKECQNAYNQSKRCFDLRQDYRNTGCVHPLHFDAGHNYQLNRMNANFTRCATNLNRLYTRMDELKAHEEVDRIQRSDLDKHMEELEDETRYDIEEVKEVAVYKDIENDELDRIIRENQSIQSIRDLIVKQIELCVKITTMRYNMIRITPPVSHIKIIRKMCACAYLEKIAAVLRTELQVNLDPQVTCDINAMLKYLESNSNAQYLMYDILKYYKNSEYSTMDARITSEMAIKVDITGRQDLLTPARKEQTQKLLNKINKTSEEIDSMTKTLAKMQINLDTIANFDELIVNPSNSLISISIIPRRESGQSIIMNNRFIDSVSKTGDKYKFTLIPGNIKLAIDITASTPLHAILHYKGNIYTERDYNIGITFHDNKIHQHWS